MGEEWKGLIKWLLSWLIFYKALLGKQSNNKISIDIGVLCLRLRLTLDQQLDLCKPFTVIEIKQATFSIQNVKSPGPHGFNSEVFKLAWACGLPGVYSYVGVFHF